MKRAVAGAVESDQRFRRDVLAGLGASPRSLPSKYFYDAAGSALFERITELDAYYPTRTEWAILEENRDEIAAALEPCAVLVEFGSGSSKKTRLLLDALSDVAAYVPIDISSEYLRVSAAVLRDEYPGLEVVPVVADYTRPFELPDLPYGRRAGFFPGSTIGNFEHADAVTFLARAARAVGEGGCLLLGVDLEKDPAVLERAYDDPEGVTARFNRNLLVRINRELGADFNPEAFRHEARFDRDSKRVEMYLVADGEQRVTVGGVGFAIGDGEAIHTENAYKYRIDDVAALAAPAGLTLARSWTDERRWFAVILFDAIVPGHGA